MTKIVTIRKRGQKPIKFKGGALHQQLGVPEGEPIPEAKKNDALAGKYGPLAKKRANFAFRGALKKGRRTAAKRKGKGGASASSPAPQSKPAASKPTVSTQKLWSNAYKKK